MAANAGATLITNNVRVSSSTLDPDPGDDDASTTVLPAQSADLAVTKEWGSSCTTFTAITQIAPNTTACVRIAATNLGPSPATGVTLVDPLPANVAYVGDDQAACVNAAGTVTCNVGTLNPSARFIALITVTVQGAAAGTTVVNTATAHAGQDDPVPENDSATDRLAVGTAADLALTKTAMPATAAVGADVTFGLTVTNGGPSAAPAVVISDGLPVGLAFVSSPTCTYDPAPAPNGVVVCPVGAMPNGGSATATIVVRPLPAVAGADVTNRATVASTGPAAVQDPDPTSNAAEAVVGVGRQADLTLTKTASPSSVPVDGTVTYTLTVANAGPNAATGVVITDRVPAALDPVSAPDCSYAAATGVVTCDVGTLAAGASASRTVTLRAGPRAAGQTAVNAASVTATEADPTPADTTARAPVTVGQQVDLRLVKTASAASVEAGSTLSYTFVVTNAGPSAATGVVVDDALPAGVTPLGATPSQGACTVTATAVSCSLGTLAAGGAAQVVVPVSVGAALAGATVTNTAAVRADQPEARPQDDAGSVTTTVTAPTTSVPTGTDTGASLRIAKTADRASATPGARVTWTLVVTNDGPAAATDVRVVDTIAGPVRVLSATGAPAACTVGRVTTCRLPTLAAGASVTIRVVGEITGTGAVTNTATATSATVDPSPADVATATTTTPLRAGSARLAVRKVGSAARARAGGLVRYRIRVRNIGPDAALDVSVCEQLPGALTYVAAPGARFRRGNACWSVGLLRRGQQRTFTVRVRADLRRGDRRVVNRATVSARNAAPRIAAARLLILGGRTGGGGVAVTG